MKGYRKPSGHYIEVSNETPVSDTLVEVALRPSPDHVFADGWATDPMNSAVCWRGKTPAEHDADVGQRCEGMDKSTKAALLLIRSYCNALKDGTYTTKTLADLKTDFITAYKAVP